MKSKQVWMKSKSYDFDEIKSVFAPPQRFHLRSRFHPSQVELSRRKTDLVKKAPILYQDWCFFLVEGDGFEPSEQDATDLQSAPFGHSGTPPYEI